MAQIKELYLWIAFFVLIVLGALYFRYYYQPQISLNVTFTNTTTNAFYPYQRVSAPITVQNTGQSGISNLSFGLYINNNLTRTYKMSIPGGKEAIVNFNFTPVKSGSYMIAIKADPSLLYNIQNRKTSQASYSVAVSAPEIAEPDIAFSSNGLLGEDAYNITPSGYTLSIFLFNNSAASQFILTPSQQINSLMYPTLDVYYDYIQNIAVGHAYYKNASLVSIWIRGYLTPTALETAAIGKGLNVTTQGNVTVINFGSNTTMCGWYSRGWLKTLSAINTESCTKLIGQQNTPVAKPSYESKFGSRSAKIYNYSGYFANYNYSGQWSVSNNNTFLYQSIEKGSNFTNVCYGTIQNISGISYCNTFYLETGNTIIEKTNALIGNYNLTSWSFTNSGQEASLTDQNVNVITSYNITGPSASFVSGYVNSCFTNSHLECFSSLWNYSTLQLGLINNYNTSITLKSAACYVGGAQIGTKLNITMAPGNYTPIAIPCYNNGTALVGFPLLGLRVHTKFVYFTPTENVTAFGNATLVK